ncbi:hypothetical protein NU688_33005 [Variovorax sp. ZS18.2.2]|uniref:hypothetical protein n=1 Tax=Variovorax sp. ZS18.2.2 TaxID=2971255 RepID=UPI00215079B0|nr:hypothetical protein [Variovorax sp. ZS18.2.2]MCR6481017.1 hypothetical protein [Variovorax sp. ZS18.2.2]
MNFNRLLFRLYCFLWSFERANFYRDLADALKRKVGIRDFFERQASNARLLRNTTSLRVYQAMSKRLASGQGSSLSDLMRGIAPASDQLLMRAVDDAGARKVEALNVSADAVEFQLRTLKTVRFELMVPLIAIPLVGALCGTTSTIVVGIAKESPPEIWHGYNGLVRWLAETINAYALVIGIATVAAVAVFMNMLPRWIGSGRLRVESWPGFSLYRDYNAAVVLTSMSMMIRSGKTLREALEAMRASASPWLRWHLARIVRSIEDNPTDYIAAFGRGLMPPTVRARLASLLDSSSSFGEALVMLGTSEIATLENRVSVSAKTVNWSLTGFFLSIAVVLSLGTMTIASALSEEASPTRMLQRSTQH